jgi:hypothetical protein
VRVEEDLGMPHAAMPVQVLDAFIGDAAEIPLRLQGQRRQAQRVQEVVEGGEAVEFGGRLRQAQFVEAGEFVQRLRPDGAGDVQVEFHLEDGVEIIGEGEHAAGLPAPWRGAAGWERGRVGGVNPATRVAARLLAG